MQRNNNELESGDKKETTTNDEKKQQQRKQSHKHIHIQPSDRPINQAILYKMDKMDKQIYFVPRPN